MNSREKGKRGERAWAKFLNDYFGLKARRGVQYTGSPDSPDVVGGWKHTHPEVKNTEAFTPDPWVEQAVRDAGLRIPYVAYKQNHKPWLLIVRADDFARFVQAVLTGTPRGV